MTRRYKFTRVHDVTSQHKIFFTKMNGCLLKNATILANYLRFRSCDHLFVTNTANSISPFSEWRNTVTCILVKWQAIHAFRIRWIFTILTTSSFSRMTLSSWSQLNNKAISCNWDVPVSWGLTTWIPGGAHICAMFKARIATKMQVAGTKHREPSVASLSYSLTPRMVAVHPSETSLNLHLCTECRIPRDNSPHNQGCENSISSISYLVGIFFTEVITTHVTTAYSKHRFIHSWFVCLHFHVYSWKWMQSVAERSHLFVYECRFHKNFTEVFCSRQTVILMGRSQTATVKFVRHSRWIQSMKSDPKYLSFLTG
jgi:hypothetical protein